MDEEINGKAVTPRLDFKEIIGLNIQFMQVFGNFFPEVQSVTGKVFYIIYAILFVGIIFVGELISEIVNIVHVIGDIEQVTEASFLSLTHQVQVGKLYYLFKYHSRVKNLVNTIDRKEFHPRNRKQYNILKRYIDDSKIITKVFLSACVLTCSFWSVYPLTVEGDRFLPLAGWFPFNTTQSPEFEIAYIYQAITSTVNGLSNISLDTFMSGFIYIGMLMSEIVNMILVTGDMEKMTEGSFLTLTHLVEICKVYAIIKYNARLKKFLTSINRAEFQPKSVSQCKALTNYVQDSKLITTMFLSACVVTCAFWGVYPYVDDGKLRLPLAGWFPFDTDESPFFEIAYAYQVFGSTVNGLVNVSLDTFMSGLIMVVCAQLNILNDSLLNMREYAKIELKEAGLELQEGMTKELQDKMDQKLLECVVHHRCIIDFANELTFLFTTSILGQFIVSVVIICITLFEITLLPWLSIKFFSLILYQFCMLLEIFLLCYYGNEVIRESSELTKFAFCSDWMDCSQEFKRNLTFFMTRSQKALKLYAGGFFTLSLETFVKILKSSWSYFAVLNSVHSED